MFVFKPKKIALSILFFSLIAVFGLALIVPSAQQRGVTINDRNKTYKGFTLFTPVGGATGKGGKNEVYLIDMDGKPVHSWVVKEPPGPYAQLLQNGNLLYAGRTDELLTGPLKDAPLIGGGGILQELDWNGNVVWEYKNKFMHHDFAKLPNGNVLVVVWERLDPSNEEKVVGGLPSGFEKKYGIWGDAILEIDYKTKEVVWEWSTEDYLKFEDYPIAPLENRLEWTHINSVAFLPEGNPYNGRPAIMTSLRQNDSVLIIDYETKDLLWSWGKDVIKHQHDPTLMKNGNILIFDNGVNRPFSQWPSSKIIEVNPKTNQIVWEYQGGGLYGQKFFSHVMGGAQELPNGNILVADSVSGRIFEVAKGAADPRWNGYPYYMAPVPKFENKIVWEYVNKYVSPNPIEGAIFRAYRYGINDIKWPVAMPKYDSDIATLKDNFTNFFK